MTGAAQARDVPRGEPVMSIGEVLARLRPEFPDISISKLRFLEAEGLVEPLRAPSGYRKYTVAHVERLRYVLAAQRDRYLPLRVIREQIEALDRGERVVGLPPAPPPPSAPVPPPSAPVPPPSAPVPPPSAPVPPRSATAPAGPISAPAGSSLRSLVPVGPAVTLGAAPGAAPVPRTELGDSRLTRAQLSQRSGLDEAGLVDLEQYGLLAANSNGFYGAEALTVAAVAARLAEYGLEGRHLRPYRTTADREVGLLAQLAPVLARQGGTAGREHALETVHELAALCAQLHGALVRQGLRQVLGS